MIHHITPYRKDKDLGRAYNDAFSMYCSPGDWICFRDIDTLFLTHDAPNIVERYIQKFDDAGILTCYTNRVSSVPQLLCGRIDDEVDINHHIRLAEMRKDITDGTQILKPISGMLMVISYNTWAKFKFKEGGKCLGVDTDYSTRILNAGLKIIRMDGLYIWHTYRLLNGVGNKKHLL